MARPVKFSDIGRGIAPEMRAKAVRLLELEEAHFQAIQDEPGAESFYTDGRHQELVGLVAVVYPALGIKLWDREPEKMLRAALNDTGGR